ncbi:hypothetical protein F8388_007309 [Cannabis sativa]|uniref:Uncharacterized protein n=1 Tax=Cannabis sativa TaxID=3483 RepID=A0A7J6G0G8_CANSA|nr:hypothetical protein F8388_007309 [Cannabis sativa]KAF4376491.1 hypothetical protein G4B88_017227 [Cannabis sativa]
MENHLAALLGFIIFLIMESIWDFLVLQVTAANAKKCHSIACLFPPIPCPIVPHWVPPDSSKLKLNVDVGLRGTDRHMGYGAVVRD